MDVVLIHLGSRLPGFAKVAAAQAEAIGGHAPVVVGPVAGRRLRGERLDRFRASERLSHMGLAGFWRYSAERLFVLEEVMRARGMSRCLHIESDNLLYVAPSAYEDWLITRYGDEVAICPLTDDEDTAAVMYVGSLPALAAFNDGLLELVELGPERLLELHGGPMANEMRMIHLLRTQRGLARALPTTPAAARELGAAQVFDPASYGQLVDGTPGAPGVSYAGDHHQVGRLLLEGELRVVWDPQQHAPRVVSRSDGAEIPLANLHIHSKRLERWTTETTPPDPPGPSLRARAGDLARRGRGLVRRAATTER